MTIKQTKEISGLKKLSRLIRNNILKACVNAGCGHIAPSFSCVEILVALYQGGILSVRPRNYKWEGRDRFILSKGHASIALYAVLSEMGFFNKRELDNFCCSGSILGAHADQNIPGVENCTGSLGHGLSVGAGLALAAKLDNKKYITAVLLGDGECQEGSVWEGAMFASSHKLSNLVAIVDYNGISATDYIADSMYLEPFKEKWEAFGWDTAVIDGHSFRMLFDVLGNLRYKSISKPLVAIALTTKGKGVSFMENNPIWHYRVPKGKELILARNQLSEKRFVL